MKKAKIMLASIFLLGLTFTTISAQELSHSSGGWVPLGGARAKSFHSKSNTVIVYVTGGEVTNSRYGVSVYIDDLYGSHYDSNSTNIMNKYVEAQFWTNSAITPTAHVHEANSMMTSR